MTQHKVSVQDPPAGTPAIAPATETPAQAEPSAGTPPVSQTELQLDPAKPPAWLAPRLQEAKDAAVNTLLKGSGLTTADELKTKLTRLAELEQAQLTESERVAKQLEDLKPKAERLGHVEQLLAKVVETQFSALPETVKTAIDAQAGGDPEKRLQLLSVMQASGLLPASSLPLPAPTPAPAPAPAPKPADTAPPGKPPAPSGTSTKYDEWNAMPEGAMKSLYFGANIHEIERSRPAQS